MNATNPVNPLLIREEEVEAVRQALDDSVWFSSRPVEDKIILNAIIDRLTDPKRVK